MDSASLEPFRLELDVSHDILEVTGERLLEGSRAHEPRHARAPKADDDAVVAMQEEAPVVLVLADGLERKTRQRPSSRRWEQGRDKVVLLVGEEGSLGQDPGVHGRVAGCAGVEGSVRLEVGVILDGWVDE